MNLLWVYTLFLAVTYTFRVHAAIPPTIKAEIEAMKPAADAIIKQVTAGPAKGQAWNRLAEMVDTFGHRLSGSDALERAIDDIIEKLIAEGFSNVHGEQAMVPHWVRGKEYATLEEPKQQPLAMLGLGSSIGTGPDGITAEVLVVDSFQDLQNKTAQAKGKIVVFNQYCDWESKPVACYGETSNYRTMGASAAANAGAVASLIRTVGAFSINSPHTGIQFYTSAVKIPTACITIEDAAMLARMQARGEKIVINLYMEAQSLPDAPSRNIIAEWPGSSKPEEVVVVSGHIDSWDVGQGAMDDGGGAFISWQTLSLLKQLNLRPKRTIRLIMWTAEEQAIWFKGSRSEPRFNRKGKRILILNLGFLLTSIVVLSARRVLFVVKPVEEDESFNGYYTPSKGTERLVWNVRFGLIREIISDILFIAGDIVICEVVSEISAGYRYRLERLSKEVMHGMGKISELVQACDDAMKALRRVLIYTYSMIAMTGGCILILIITLATTDATGTVTQLMLIPVVLIFVIGTMFSGVWASMVQHTKSSYDIIRYREEGRTMVVLGAGKGAAAVATATGVGTRGHVDDRNDDGGGAIAQDADDLPPWNALDDASDGEFEVGPRRAATAPVQFTDVHHSSASTIGSTTPKPKKNKYDRDGNYVPDSVIFNRYDRLFRPKLGTVTMKDVLRNLWQVSTLGFCAAVPPTVLVLPTLILVTPMVVDKFVTGSQASISDQEQSLSFLDICLYGPMLHSVPFALIGLAFGTKVMKKGFRFVAAIAVILPAIWGIAIVLTTTHPSPSVRLGPPYTLLALSFLYFALYLYQSTSLDIHWTYLFTAGSMGVISIIYVIYLIPLFAGQDELGRLRIQLGIHAPLRTLVTLASTIVYAPLRRISSEYKFSVVLAHGLHLMMITLNRLLIANVASLTSQAFIAILIGAVELSVRITTPVNMVVLRRAVARLVNRPNGLGFKATVLEVDYIQRQYVTISRLLLKIQAEYMATLLSFFVSLIYRGIHMTGERITVIAGPPIAGALVQIVVQVLIDIGSFRLLSNWHHMPLIPVWNKYGHRLTIMNVVAMVFLVAVLSTSISVVSAGFDV